MSWQPIETAPKDGFKGKRVVVLAPDDDVAVVAFHGNDPQEPGSAECWRCAWDHSAIEGGYDFAYWMPLPPAPQEKG